MSRFIVRVPGWLVLVIAVLLGAAAISTLTVQVHTQWIDPVTGARKTQTRWLSFFNQSPSIKPSALDRWLVQQRSPLPHHWHLFSSTGRALIGTPTYFACGSMPPIGSMGHDRIRLYVEQSTDAELQAFIQTMRQGTQAEQKAAVEAANEIVFLSLKSP